MTVKTQKRTAIESYLALFHTKAYNRIGILYPPFKICGDALYVQKNARTNQL